MPREERIPLKRKVLVQVDTREKNPVFFPDRVIWSPEPFKRDRQLLEVVTEKKELEFGDYRLADFPESCVIERKGSLDELAQNLITRDRGRFHAAFERLLNGCRHPVLMIEAAAYDTRLRGNYESITVPDIHGALHRHLGGIPNLVVYWVGRTGSVSTREQVGAHMVRLMMSFAETDKERGIL